MDSFWLALIFIIFLFIIIVAIIYSSSKKRTTVITNTEIPQNTRETITPNPPIITPNPPIISVPLEPQVPEPQAPEINPPEPQNPKELPVPGNYILISVYDKSMKWKEDVLLRRKDAEKFTLI